MQFLLVALEVVQLNMDEWNVEIEKYWRDKFSEEIQSSIMHLEGDPRIQLDKARKTERRRKRAKKQNGYKNLCLTLIMIL